MPGRTVYCVLSLAILVVGGSRSAVAQTNTPRLTWRIIDYAPVPSHVLRIAKAETERVYMDIGVAIQDEEQTPEPARTVTVIILDAHRADLKALSSHALGTAPGTPTARGTIAYILYDRIESAARRHARMAGELLGLVIAHEIGHLLLPHNAHAQNSIMQADWDSAFITQSPTATFTADQAAFIRSELAEPVGSRRALTPESR